MQAQSAFTVDKKDAHPAEWPGGQMSHTRFYKTFSETIRIVNGLIAEIRMEFDPAALQRLLQP